MAPRVTSPGEVVVLRHDPCTWLPAGGTAEVVLCPGAVAPEPTVVVRLLAVAIDAILVVERPDGRGLDLPTAPAGADPEQALRHWWPLAQAFALGERHGRALTRAQPRA